MRVHDQLYSQAEEPAREVHDEQCTGELHDTAGNKVKRSANNGAEIALGKPVIETRLDDSRAQPIVRENGTQDKSGHSLDLRS